MAPLADNLTNVLYVDYTDGFHAHTFQVRYTNPVIAPADAQAYVAEFLGKLTASMLSTWGVTGVRVREAGQTVSLPVLVIPALSVLTGTSGESPSDYKAAYECVWVGRSLTTGRRVRLSLFGLRPGFVGDYRFGATEWPPAAVDAVDVLNTSDGAFVALDGTEARWANYVNVNFNSYWERAARG